MAKATGIGGVFLRAENPDLLYAWYAEHLGVHWDKDGGILFDGPESNGMTVFAFFPKSTRYFGPGTQQAMVNFRVEGLDALLEALQAAQVEIDPHREEYSYGRFAWIVDPEGNRIELWEAGKPE